MSVISCGAIPVSFDLDIFSPPTSSQPWPKTVLRQRQPGGHQHGRPDHRVEARDVLADDVDVAGQGRSNFVRVAVP